MAASGADVDVRIATYNIHRCRGMDRRVDPARIIEVLRDINADVIALQEVIGAGPAGSGQAEEIGAGLGMGWVMNCVRTLRQHQFGNVVLSRHPIVHHSQYDLSWRTCEPRNCQRADLNVNGQIIHIYNVHLGTAVLERRYQAKRLASFVHDRRVTVSRGGRDTIRIRATAPIDGRASPRKPSAAMRNRSSSHDAFAVS